jgi:hypothetical protein
MRWVETPPVDHANTKANHVDRQEDHAKEQEDHAKRQEDHRKWQGAHAERSWELGAERRRLVWVRGHLGRTGLRPRWPRTQGARQNPMRVQSKIANEGKLGNLAILAILI